MKPAYPGLLFYDSLRDRKLEKITLETDLNKLNQVILESKKVDPRRAILFAEKMAIYYGVPGLLHYVDIKTLLLTKDHANGENVQTDCVDALQNLFLAKKIFGDDRDKTLKELKSISCFQKVEEKSFWDEKIDHLVRLGNIDQLLLDDTEKSIQKEYATLRTP